MTTIFTHGSIFRMAEVHEDLIQRTKKAVREHGKKVALAGAIGLGAIGGSGLALIIQQEQFDHLHNITKAEDVRTFEANHTLTNSPSAVSVSGWRVRYPDLKEGVSYEIDKTTKESKITYTTDSNYIGIDIGEDFTNIIISPYKNSRDKYVPRLTVFTDTSTSTYESQSFILSDGSTKTTQNTPDIRVVTFEKPKTGESRYFQIKMDDSQGSNPEHIILAEMKPVAK